MQPIRTVLWLSRGEEIPVDLAGEAPTLDFVWERSVEGALALAPQAFDALVIDAGSAAEALVTLRALRAAPRLPPLLVRLAEPAEGARAQLLAAGAADVLPREPEAASAAAELRARVEKLARGPARLLEAPLATPAPAPAQDGFVGESPEMRQVFGLIACASRARATVLISGETGTGKELIARAIHRGSPRAARPFVAVNCAAFPDTLLESELFGSTKGAFTGADRDRAGLFEAADGGSLFLDEVSETSGPFQAKLLRVLQERELRPVGGTRSRRVDVRVIAASNRDLWRQSHAGAFRADLYYRLAVFPIQVPSLRERLGDILPLAARFLALHGDAAAPSSLAPDAARLLQAYAWPGNVRELENEIQRALALVPPGATLAAEHFSARLREPLAPVAAELQPGESLRESLDRVEAWLIRRELDAHGGRRAETARRLSITREGLYKKMRRLGIA
ncbi:MAG TPA: sigma 54-interacting transcriptional regulator [Myxococcota bacterium]|jgi:transcriptional regulator with PAS, ATPase and Fis domain